MGTCKKKWKRTWKKRQNEERIYCWFYSSMLKLAAVGTFKKIGRSKEREICWYYSLSISIIQAETLPPWKRAAVGDIWKTGAYKKRKSADTEKLWNRNYQNYWKSQNPLNYLESETPPPKFLVLERKENVQKRNGCWVVCDDNYSIFHWRNFVALNFFQLCFNLRVVDLLPE